MAMVFEDHEVSRAVSGHDPAARLRFNELGDFIAVALSIEVGKQEHRRRSIAAASASDATQ